MMSGARSVGASAAPTAISAMPASRQRVCHSISHKPPAIISTKASARHRRHAQHGARHLGDAMGDPHHRLDAAPHHPQRQRFQPERHGDQRRQRRRHDDDVAHGQGDEIGDHRILLALVEVIGGERRHGRAGDQRRQHDAGKEQDEARGRVLHQRLPGPPLAQRLVDRNERQHGGERHLEADVEQAFGKDDEDQPSPPG